MPFKDDSIDYIFCSHVLEDFIETIPIIQEFTRICKKGGKIEIEVPFETNVNYSLNHKRGFVLQSFVDYLGKNKDYGISIPLKIEKLLLKKDKLYLVK